MRHASDTAGGATSGSDFTLESEMQGGPVEIYREGVRRGVVVHIAAALDLAAVLRDWPFGPGRFWLWRGDRCERYEAGTDVGLMP